MTRWWGWTSDREDGICLPSGQMTTIEPKGAGRQTASPLQAALTYYIDLPPDVA